MSLITLKFPGGDRELTFPVDKFVSINLIRGDATGHPALDITLAGAVGPNLVFFCDNRIAEKLRSQILHAVESKESDGKHWELTWDDPGPKS